MPNFAYLLEAKAEIPQAFLGQTVNFETQEQLPENQDSFDDPANVAALVAQARQMFDGCVSVSAALISVFNLQRQKDIKDETNKKDATLETVQAAASSFKPLHKRLRGTTEGKPKAATGKQKAKTELEVLRQMEAEATDPATKAFLADRAAKVAERLAALGAAAPAQPAAEAPAEQPKGKPAKK